jgi:SAM-dependent methyltransferase
MPNRRDNLEYVRDVQYHDPGKLTARANLHVTYGTATTQWFPWLAGQITWPESSDVLEIGCGPGWLWAEVANELPTSLHMTLTDLSEKMVEIAAKRVRRLSRFERVDSRVTDAQALPFDNESFDVVVANHVLYHVPEPLDAVREIARVLRRGGCLLAATSGPGNMRELREVSSEVFGHDPGDPATPFGKHSGIEKLNACFADVEWRTYEDRLRCTDVDDIVAYMTSFPPGENATYKESRKLRRLVQERIDRGNGAFSITKETGAFVVRVPMHVNVERPTNGT